MALKRADESSAAEALRDMVEFFDEHGALHFRVEEEVLLPLYVRDGGADPSDGAIARVLTDHVLFPAIERALSTKQLESLGLAVAAAEHP